ncbi:MAG: TIGR03885 family FMN-dependent LLM class oxidoreductase [Methanomicrobiales archaeon]|nr:TIGR03885 family FMN-dependent LLM class oxidoreductase [Methanomicrobiales archaeon]
MGARTAGIGYHASHEQFPPGRLLDLTRAAESAGFETAMASDHFKPWSESQGESGFVWSWLGAALQATRFPLGVVTVPGYRYHPAILAQAGATLAEMFPGRFWMAVGSGEQLNESITGERWPTGTERDERLLRCVQVMRALWAGETVTSKGLVRVESARLYTLPRQPPLLLAAATSRKTAEWAGGWADGLITVGGPNSDIEGTIEAFREGGGEGSSVYLKADISYARTEQEALEGAWDQWRYLVHGGNTIVNTRSPALFEAFSRHVRPGDMPNHLWISSSLERYTEWLRECLALGIDRIILHNVNREQGAFIEDFGREVIPALHA